MELISVILPIYNVEKYLGKCVQSVFNQTYRNLEIILVDDGSTDNCSKLCDSYAKLDNRVIVIHKKNGGLSDARNAGTDIANGDYIFYLDSDDWIALDTIELLYATAKKYNADIAECSYASVYSNAIRYLTNCTGKVTVADFERALAGMFCFKDFLVVAWNKLYKRNIIGNIRYPVGKFHEDEFTTHKFYMASKTVISIDVCKYYYYQARMDSITGTKYSEKMLDAVEAYHIKVNEIWNGKFEALYQVANDNYSYKLFTNLYKCHVNNINGRKLDETISMALNDYRVINNKKMPLNKSYIPLYKALDKGMLSFAKEFKNSGFIDDVSG